MALTNEQIDTEWRKHKDTLSGWDYGGTDVMYEGAFEEAARAIESAATAPLLERIAHLEATASANYGRGQADAHSMLSERIAEQDETLRFVERWANHHGTKPNMTPEEALSCIQHYPAIRAITHGYADGQMPETPNPWGQLRELQSYVASLEQQLSEARKDAERWAHACKGNNKQINVCSWDGDAYEFVGYAMKKEAIDAIADAEIAAMKGQQ